MWSTLLFMVVLCVNFITSARIFCYFSFPSISHQVVYQPLWKELSRRGHQVTVLTTNPLKDENLKNLTEIDLSSSYEILKKLPLQESISHNLGQTDQIQSVFSLFEIIFDHQMNIPVVKTLIENGKADSFDLVIVEAFYPSVFAFSELFNSPVIGMSSLNLFPNSHSAIGNPMHPVLNPNMFFYNIYEKMTIWDRIHSVFITIWYNLWYEYQVLPKFDKLVKKHFGNSEKYIGDVEKSMSMMFLYVNPVVHPFRPDFPNVVSLRLMHIKPQRELPADLKNILEGAKNGVIYMSLGSNVQSSKLPEEMRKSILEALSELPYTVLWKFELDDVMKAPKNVIMRKWFPQRDLLAHPNVKVFITQGGLQSLEEALVNGVPVVGMPFIADQPMNLQKIEKLGGGLMIDPNNFSKYDLKRSVMEVSENGSYRKVMGKLRGILLDQPTTGLERAVWWTEYVIRHEGAKHMRSPASDMPLYQYLLLDVLAVVVTGSFVSYKVIKYLFCYVTAVHPISYQKIKSQ